MVANQKEEQKVFNMIQSIGKTEIVPHHHGPPPNISSLSQN
jgi:hypothetical protein